MGTLRIPAFLFPISILLSFLAPTHSAHGTEPFYKENTAYQWITQRHRFTHHVDFRYLSGLSASFGGSYRLAYSLGEYAVDLQGSYDRTQWGSLGALPPDNSTVPTGTAVSDPSSQINLPRNAADKWTALLIETGLSYRGRLVPRTATKWIQNSRLSFGRVMLSDQANALSFTGISMNVEFSIWYQLLPKLLIGPTFGYRFGWAFLDGSPNVETNRIPIQMLQATLGTVFRF
jgi:hypothetical protein